MIQFMMENIMIIGNSQSTNIFLNRNSYLPQNKKDSVTKEIEKQIENLQEQISKISNKENLSVEQKLDMQNDLREQIDDLNKQLVKANLEKHAKELKEAQVQSIKQEDTSLANGGLSLISLSSSLKQVSIQKTTNTKMKGKAKILANEIKLDEERGVDVTYKKDELSQIKSSIENMSKRIQNTMKDVNNQIKKSNDQAKEKEGIKEDQLDKTSNSNNKKLDSQSAV